MGNVFRLQHSSHGLLIGLIQPDLKRETAYLEGLAPVFRSQKNLTLQ